MFLQRLVLRNLRSIEHLELGFTHPDGSPRQWTLLLGENGCGKSTVLRAIALGLAGSNALPELLVDNDDWIRAGQDAASIEMDLVTTRGEPRHLEFRLRRGDGLSETFLNNRDSLVELDRIVTKHTDGYFTIGYGVSRRLRNLRSASFSNAEVMRQPRAQRVATLFSPDATLRPIEAWALDLDYRQPEEAQRILSDTFAGMLPGIAYSNIDKERRKLLFETPDGILPLDLLSDGYQNIISWCGDLLYRVTESFAQHLGNPLEARGLLLIDEVDLHLHPLWQRRLIEFLHNKLRNFQIFATTHSPLTAHQASEGELYLLRRAGGSAPPHIEPFPGDPRKLLLHQFILSPAFGLETADSLYIEELKQEYGQLQQFGAESPGGLERETVIAEELADAPQWQLNSEQAKERLDLLAEIRQELGNRR